ncbi:MAG TPA: AMP-binding protein [Caulobacteraceae bacterium]
MSNLLFDALLGAGARDAPAIEAGGRRLTYAALALETARWARTLTALGLKPGDRLAVQVEKSLENLLLYLGALRAGAVFLPLNPAYTAAELAFFVADAEPALIVCDPARREAVAAIAGEARIETLDASGEGSLADLAAGQTGAFDTVQRLPEDLAAICYTSGTTGRSKGAMLSHRALVSNAAALKDLWRFSGSDVLINALPIYHVHGLFVATHISLMAGGSMILQPKFDPDAVLAALPAATAMMGVPTFYTRLLANAGLTAAATAHVRLFISGSAPLPPAVHKAWEARTGQAILERYGMTETGMNASNPYDGPRLAGAVGPPVPGVALRIVDEGSDEPVEEGSVGLVQVRGPNLFSGYWRNAARTVEAFAEDGWFRTGDLGRRDEAGYLWLVGRSSDLIISGGLNVYPAEVEAAIEAAPGVRESAVIGALHADLGEAVVAVVVAEAPVSEDDILAALQGRLARFKQPRRIVFVDALPRNAMGKVVKADLRRTYAGLFSA